MHPLRRRRALRAVLPLVVVLSCSEDDDPIDPGEDGDTIGPTGGTVVSEDGNAQLTVQAGALHAQTEITIEPAAAPPAHPGLIAGTAYELQPDGLTFHIPALLTVRYDEGQLPVGALESQLRIHRSMGATWIPVSASVVDAEANAVTASLAGFSTYAILHVEPEEP